ncbi:hypothetical protein [Pseudomonas phage phi176]|uniref:Tape measure protein n=2 Tax=root TaxID=1 RepID=A0A0A7NUY2_9CAUD|nr:hypothetical protein [Pseudomonas phage phi176]
MADFLEMSDDDLPEFYEVEEQTRSDQEEPEQGQQDDVQSEEVVQEEEEPADEEQEEEQEEEQDPLNSPDDELGDLPAEEKPTEEKSGQEEEDGDKEESEDTPTEEEPEAKKSEATKQEVDPADFMAKITAPFKANGRDLQVKTPEEAIRLMQMGANYNHKMSALKPNLHMMRQLDDAGLLNPETIANVVDLLKHKKPEAIAKLAKDAGVDPLDLDEKSVADYKPTAVPFNQVREALDEQLDSIEHSPSYNRVVTTLGKLDKTSQKLVSEHPQVIGYFEQHMTNGVFDRIDSEIQRRKAFGTITDSTPYLHAYKAVGDELQAQGAFDDLAQASATESQRKAPAEPVKRVTTRTKAQEAAVKEKRRAAAPTKTVAGKAKPAQFDPLAMSDEEFEKLGFN